MIGERSIVLYLKVLSKAESKAESAALRQYEVKIQANRNFGICDVVLPNEPVPPVFIEDSSYKTETRKKREELYQERKAEYDREMAKRKSIRDVILNRFQGRQINDSYIVESIKNTLSQLLNCE